jgi:hypothetical protein
VHSLKIEIGMKFKVDPTAIRLCFQGKSLVNLHRLRGLNITDDDIGTVVVERRGTSCDPPILMGVADDSKEITRFD